MPYWGDTVLIWHRAASDIIEEQAMEEETQRRSRNEPVWGVFSDWMGGASAIVKEQALEEETEAIANSEASC